MANQIAHVAIAYQTEQTGHAPAAVTVVVSEDTLVITMHDALTPAEKALAQSPAGAAQVQEFHRQLFHTSANSLREEIKKSLAGTYAKRPPKSSRRVEPWSMLSLPATSFRCTCSPRKT